MRLRLSPQAGLTATGAGGAGEVEDYPLTIIAGGTVVVTKNTVGGNGSFAFTSTIPAAGSFSLATSGNTASRTFGGVAPGTYAISETVPAGWALTGATCSNGTPDSFTLAAGATVTCTFTNTQLSADYRRQAHGGRRRQLCLHERDLDAGDLHSDHGGRDGAARASPACCPAATTSARRRRPAGT